MLNIYLSKISSLAVLKDFVGESICAVFQENTVRKKLWIRWERGWGGFGVSRFSVKIVSSLIAEKMRSGKV